MGLWRLLGGEVNWERVARMQDLCLATEIHISIIDALGGGSSINISLSIDRLNDDDKNNAMWVLEKFGRIIPITAKYTWLKNSHINNASELHPKNTDSKQIRWDQAWEWYDEYKSGTIPFLEYRIQIREKELEEMEEDLKHFKATINKFGKNRTQIKLIKSYEEKIPLRKKEIVKLKRELEPKKKNNLIYQLKMKFLN
ncbi:hypothetical protein [Spiroplasma citri]|uniref:Uncharacterized protein n=1 Tax=Spiroplasma citri TaxID=2133 RepID=Q14MV3_SPICI|nr:hypothetical protein [Spiroplasma citri]APE74837.1 hypothetical protein SCITRI_00952 [Spiroplasma citri]QED24758.1 hypothetical protein FRX96_04845 [Spiroplasma citri]QED24763.1 hypothetical protein FRX96_04880 [Spiroplasma citri]QIA67110.1 hypothetical protein GMI18_05300 [Spiroplasma citri]QIA69012.1 hypothetical protein GL298_05505 [Spiroplasma citri]